MFTELAEERGPENPGKIALLKTEFRLLTNDEMDGQFDEEDEDDTWNSVDIDDDLTEEV